MVVVRIFLYLAVAVAAWPLAKASQHDGFLAQWPYWVLAGITGELFFSVEVLKPKRPTGERPKKLASAGLFVVTALVALLTKSVDQAKASFPVWLTIGWATSLFFGIITDAVVAAATGAARESIRASGISRIDLPFERRYFYECVLTTGLCVAVCLLAGRRLTDWETRAQTHHGHYSLSVLAPSLFILLLWFVVPVLAGVGAATAFQSGRRIVDRDIVSRPIYPVLGVLIFAVVTTGMYLTVYSEFTSELARLSNS